MRARSPTVSERKKMREFGRKFGGASRDRTDDLIVANDALSQLSYSPTCGNFNFTSRHSISPKRARVRELKVRGNNCILHGRSCCDC